MSTAPYSSLWDGIVDGWRVWVGRYGETTPIVTATKQEPFLLRQTMIEQPTPRKVREWVQGLNV